MCTFYCPIRARVKCYLLVWQILIGVIRLNNHGRVTYRKCSDVNPVNIPLGMLVMRLFARNLLSKKQQHHSCVAVTRLTEGACEVVRQKPIVKETIVSLLCGSYKVN